MEVVWDGCSPGRVIAVEKWKNLKEEFKMP